ELRKALGKIKAILDDEHLQPMRRQLKITAALGVDLNAAGLFNRMSRMADKEEAIARAAESGKKRDLKKLLAEYNSTELAGTSYYSWTRLLPEPAMEHPLAAAQALGINGIFAQLRDMTSADERLPALRELFGDDMENMSVALVGALASNPLA